jgi:hypothetical protein
MHLKLIKKLRYSSILLVINEGINSSAISTVTTVASILSYSTNARGKSN